MLDRLENYTWQRGEGNEKTAANRTRASNLQTLADPLAAESRLPPASIDPFPS